MTVSVVDLLVPSSVAVSVTPVLAATFRCVTLNVAEVLPAAIVTVAGMVAAALSELLNVTTKPPVGAAELSETVPVTAVVELPLTEVGDTATETRLGGVSVSVDCCEVDAYVAVIVAPVVVLTADVVTVNWPLSTPTGTLTVAGTVADLELELSLTETGPLEPGSAFRTTSPATFVPPAAVPGDRFRASTSNGVTVSVHICLTPA